MAAAPWGAGCGSAGLGVLVVTCLRLVQETYGEDPFLTGELARSFVQGLQGQHPRYIKASAGCKHFSVHGGPENIPVSRLSFNAKVSMAGPWDGWRPPQAPTSLCGPDCR